MHARPVGLGVLLLLSSGPIAAQSGPAGEPDPKFLSSFGVVRSTEGKQTGFNLRVEPVRLGDRQPIFLGIEVISFYKTIDAATETSAGSVAFGVGASTLFGTSALRPHVGASVYNIWSYGTAPGVDYSETAWLKVLEVRGGVTWLTGIRWKEGRRGLVLQAEAAQQFAEGGQDLVLKAGLGVVRLR